MSGGGLPLVIDRLACPVCQAPVTLDERVVSCSTGHRFDVARQGYLSLLGGGARAKTGDSAAMVAARERFLATAHYAPIARAVSLAVASDAGGLCVDLAGGTGYYLGTLLDDHPGLVGLDLDLSTAALRRAARAHTRLAAVAADVWQPLPIKSSSVECVLSVFGPRNVLEVARVLDTDGQLIVAGPSVRHLGELVGRLGLVTVDPDKQTRLERQLRSFARVSDRTVEYPVRLVRQDVLDEVLMGPSAHHVDPAALAVQVDSLALPIEVTVSVQISVWVRKP